MPFKVIYEDSDSRINEYNEEYFSQADDSEEKFETFEEALEAVKTYLRDLIERCKETLESFEEK